jgi:hypothetical protein
MAPGGAAPKTAKVDAVAALHAKNLAFHATCMVEEQDIAINR